MKLNLSTNLPFTSKYYKDLKNCYYNNWFLIETSDTKFSKLAKHSVNIGKRAIVLIAGAISTIALPIIAAVDFTVHKIKSRKVKSDCHFLLNSNIFDSYIKQLSGFVDKNIENCKFLKKALTNPKTGDELSDRGIDLINKIKRQPSNKPAERLRYHQEMLKEFRELLILKDKKDNHTNELQAEICEFLDKLSLWIYNSPKLWNGVTEFMQDQINFDKILGKSGSLSEFVDKSYNRVTGKSQYTGIIEPKNGRLYDPHMLGDTPFVLFSLPNSNKTRFIRTPNVARDTERDFSNNLHIKSIIAEEFRNFVLVNKAKGNSHLYINLMFRNGRSEEIRTKVIESLESDPEMKGAIDIATLDKNSYFYKQEKDFSDMSNAARFIKTFHSQMFDLGAQGSFYWPKRLDLLQWKIECNDLLQYVHKEYFQNRSELTREERQNFIEIFYTKLISRLVEKLEPKTCNISCLSTIDRGACASALLYADKIAKKGQNKNPKKMKKLASLALAPAILTQNRPTQSDRLERLTPALRMIAG